MIELGVFAALALIYAVYRDHRSRADYLQLLADIASEREVWAKERTDLNNRIQIPEAAPYMADDPSAGADDLPLPPGPTVNEDEYAQAMAELQEVGYEEGPV